MEVVLLGALQDFAGSLEELLILGALSWEKKQKAIKRNYTAYSDPTKYLVLRYVAAPLLLLLVLLLFLLPPHGPPEVTQST